MDPKKRFEMAVGQPFQPDYGVSSRPAAPEQRIAAALEYIAAQLGQINRKLDRLLPPQG